MLTTFIVASLASIAFSDCDISAPVFSVSQKVVPGTSVHWVDFQGVEYSTKSKSVLVTGIGVKNNFLASYDPMTGKMTGSKTWSKTQGTTTNIVWNMNRLGDDVFVTGYGLLNKVNPSTLDFDWQTQLPLLGTCRAENMLIDNLLAEGNTLYATGSCQTNNSSYVFIDTYDMNSGAFQKRLPFKVGQFIKDPTECSGDVVIGTDIAKSPKANVFYMGVKCISTTVAVVDGSSGSLSQMQSWVNNKFAQVKKFVHGDKAGDVYILNDPKLYKWSTDSTGKLKTQLWSVLVREGETNLDAWSFELSSNENVVWVITTANDGQLTYLLNYKASDGSELSNKFPLAGILRQVAVVEDAIYVVDTVKIGGFPEGILLKFGYPQGCP